MRLYQREGKVKPFILFSLSINNFGIIQFNLLYLLCGKAVSKRNVHWYYFTKVPRIAQKVLGGYPQVTHLETL